MPALIPGYEYDIFISYRQKDNKGDHWVSGFVKALKDELDAAFKDELNIYFDENPHDGLHEMHDVDDSLKEKIKCLIFIPILSRTYCDPKSFAWQHEFLPFRDFASGDSFGLKIKLANGNVVSRVLPVRIYELTAEDTALFEGETKGPIRAIDFVYKSAGVNRPLLSYDKKEDNLAHTVYRDQVNKMANVIGDIITSMRRPTPSTDNRTEQKREIKKPTTSTGKKIWVSLIAVLVVVLGFWLTNKFIGDSQTRAGEVNDKSVAVLPFINRSNNDEDRYFSDGMHDEIRSRLAKISGLRVLSRSSVEYYRESTKTTKEISRELGIAYVLEGSVQRVAGRIRIRIELIDAAIESQIWSESYDRQLTTDNLLNIQSEVAQSVGRELGALISVGENKRIGKKSTDNLQAYDFYLRAFTMSNLMAEAPREDLVASKKYYEEAIRLDPNFAIAYAMLSDIDSWFILRGWDRSDALKLAALTSAKRALELDPELPEAHYAMATYYYRIEKDYNRALDAIKIAEAGLPGEGYLILLRAYTLRRKGQWQEALYFLEQAQSIDPLSDVPLFQIAYTYRWMRLYDKAEEYYKRASEINPNRRFQLNIAEMTFFRDADTLKFMKTFKQPVVNHYEYWQAEFFRRDWLAAIAALERSGIPFFEWQDWIIPVSLCKGWTLSAAGNSVAAKLSYQEAIEELKVRLQVSTQDERLHRSLGLAFAGLGEKQYAIKECQLALQILPPESDAFSGPYNIEGLAMMYAQFGESKLAVDYLRKFFSSPGHLSVKFVSLDPRYDRIRQSSEFKAFIKEFDHPIQP